MIMKTSCPYCGQHYELDDSAIGAVATCENCCKDFTVGEAAAEPQPETKEQLRPVISNPAPTATRCPYCGGEIAPGVKKCRHCGEWIRKDNRGKIIVLVVAGLVVVALVITGILLVFNRVTVSTKSGQAETAKSKSIYITVVADHFAHSEYGATCLLYKNHREILRKETTVGIVLFEHVECSEKDVFKIEMQYRNGYGAIVETTDSYSRIAEQRNKHDVLILEPQWEHDRVPRLGEIVDRAKQQAR